MADRPWNPDESTPNEKRALSPKEREYLMSGDSGSYPTAEMERRVSEKVEKVPNRIQQLIDDVSLVYYGGHLSDSIRGSLWENLLDVSIRSKTVRDSPIVRTWQQGERPQLDFGFEIGSVIRYLASDAVSADLIWGLIIGLVGEPEDKNDIEVARLVELFEELQNRYEWRLASLGSYQESGFDEEHREIRGLLREKNIAPAPPLVTAIIMEATSTDTDLKPPDIDGALLDDMSEADHPTPPDEMPTPEEMRQTEFAQIIDRFLEQTPLRAVDRLARDLREDAVVLSDKELYGAEADQLFEYLVEADGEVHVQEFPLTEVKGQNNVTGALNRLSSTASTWVNRPVVEASLEEDHVWSVTDYGELLSKTRLEHNCATNWIYTAVPPSASLDNELEDLILKVANSED